ncbi:MAG: hypothetical protein QHG98_04555 [Methanothrix sp.]|jgi:hypothetical protein|uniref:hypothetical protein n=1 Tax=Methanothrix sp. TaxID=90426 RepID=UPI00247DB856|nr:hypothetical protein [Methanothrix sp.]
MRYRLLALLLLMLVLSAYAEGPSVSPAPPTPSEGGGGGSSHRQTDMEKIIKALEQGKKQNPKRFEYLQTLLWKEYTPPGEYRLPAVLIYYKGNTTVRRSDPLEIQAYVTNENELEIRRPLYIDLEMAEPGGDFRRVNSQTQIVQVNEYFSTDGINYTYRSFPEITDLRSLKETGRVRFRIKYTDSLYKMYSSNWSVSSPQLFPVLELNVINNPPVVNYTNVTYRPRYSDPIEYVADIMDPDGDTLNVTLHILNEDNSTERTNVTQELRGSGTVRFRNSEYGFFGKEDAGKTFRYYYTVGDGINVTSTNIAEGPEIRPTPKLLVESPRMVAEDENYYWWGRYNFSIDVKSQDENSFPLTVYLYTSTPSNPWKLRGSRTVTVTPERQTVSFETSFDVSDSNQTFAYRFSYSEPDQNGRTSMDLAADKPINPKIVKYSILSPLGIANVILTLIIFLSAGVIVERVSNNRGRKKEIKGNQEGGR